MRISILVILKVILFLNTTKVLCNDDNLLRRLKNEISTKDGLISNCVYDIEFDSLNRIWISTDKGVTVYDGFHFKNFSFLEKHKDSEIFRLKIDVLGRVWCISSSNKIYMIKNDKIYHLDLVNNKNEFKTYSWVTSLSEDIYGSVFFGTFSGEIFELNRKNKFKSRLPFMNNLSSKVRIISNVFHGDEKKCFTYLSGVGLNVNDSLGKSSVVKYPISFDYFYIEDEFNYYGYRNDSVYKIYNNLIVDKFYIGYNLKMVSFFKTNKNKILLCDGFSAVEIDKKLKIASLIIKENGIGRIIEKGNYYFITTNTKGILITDIRNKVFYSENGPIVSLKSIGGSLFVGGYYGNLYKFNGVNIIKYKLESSNSNSLARIFDVEKLSNRENIIALESNFTIERDGNFFYFPFGSKCYAHDSVNGLIGYSNNIFLFKIKSLDQRLKFENTFRSGYSKKIVGVLPGFRVFTICKFKFGDFLAGTNKGLFRVRMSNSQFFVDSIKGFSSSIRSIYQFDAGKFIIFGDFEGLKTLDLRNGNIFNTESQALNGARILKIRPSFSRYKLWLCTDKGLFLLNFSRDFKTYDLIHYGNSITELSTDVNDICFAFNKWWVATGMGLYVFESNFYQKKIIESPDLITSSFIVNDLKIHDQEKSLDLIEGNSNISFSFGCMSFAHFGDFKFRYRLNSSGGWLYTDKFDHNLNNLSTGDYQIEVQARSPNSPWSASLFYPAFSVLPPFWERTWVILLTFGIFFSMVFALVYNVQRVRIAGLRLESEKTDSNLKALRNQMKPHFLSNILNSMQYFILNEKDEEAGTFINSFSRLVRNILDSSDANYLSLKLELTQLSDYVAFECKRAGRDVDFHLKLQEDADFSNVLIPTMLIQPLLENSLMHGIFAKPAFDAAEIVLCVHKVESNRFRSYSSDKMKISNKGRLIVLVSDNGQGQAKSMQRKHRRYSQSFGMKTIRERLVWIEKKFRVRAFMEINDLYDLDGNPCGTSVLLNLPLIISISGHPDTSDLYSA